MCLYLGVYFVYMSCRPLSLLLLFSFTSEQSVWEEMILHAGRMGGEGGFKLWW